MFIFPTRILRTCLWVGRCTQPCLTRRMSCRGCQSCRRETAWFGGWEYLRFCSACLQIPELRSAVKKTMWVMYIRTYVHTCVYVCIVLCCDSAQFTVSCLCLTDQIILAPSNSLCSVCMYKYNGTGSIFVVDNWHNVYVCTYVRTCIRRYLSCEGLISAEMLYSTFEVCTYVCTHIHNPSTVLFPVPRITFLPPIINGVTFTYVHKYTSSGRKWSQQQVSLPWYLRLAERMYNSRRINWPNIWSASLMWHLHRSKVLLYVPTHLTLVVSADLAER